MYTFFPIRPDPQAQISIHRPSDSPDHCEQPTGFSLEIKGFVYVTHISLSKPFLEMSNSLA